MKRRLSVLGFVAFLALSLGSPGPATPQQAGAAATHVSSAAP